MHYIHIQCSGLNEGTISLYIVQGRMNALRPFAMLRGRMNALRPYAMFRVECMHYVPIHCSG